MFGVRKDLSSLQKELKQGFKQGRKQNRGQTRRIQELQSRAATNPETLSRAELSFLDSVDQLALEDLQQRAALQEAAELRGYQKQVAQGQSPSNPDRFDELIKAETARRNQAARQQLGRSLAIGGSAGALGLGALAVASGASPMGMMGGADEQLVMQRFRIEKELEEREFQNALAQRTATAQTDLDNRLMAMQQRAIFEQNLANSLQAQQASGGSGVDIIQKINSLAAGYQSQGIEPAKAFDLAQNAIRMDGSANAYL